LSIESSNRFSFVLDISTIIAVECYLCKLSLVSLSC